MNCCRRLVSVDLVIPFLFVNHKTPAGQLIIHMELGIQNMLQNRTAIQQRLHQLSRFRPDVLNFFENIKPHFRPLQGKLQLFKQGRPQRVVGIGGRQENIHAVWIWVWRHPLKCNQDVLSLIIKYHGRFPRAENRFHLPAKLGARSRRPTPWTPKSTLRTLHPNARHEKGKHKKTCRAPGQHRSLAQFQFLRPRHLHQYDSRIQGESPLQRDAVVHRALVLHPDYGDRGDQDGQTENHQTAWRELVGPLTICCKP